VKEEMITTYRLNTEQATIIESIRRIADEEIAPHATDVDAKSRFPSEAVKALASAGFFGLNIPKQYGGMGQGLRVTCAALDEIAQRDASAAMVFMMHICGCATYVASPDAAKDIIPLVVAGRHLATLAWSERGSRSHFWAPVSQASQNDGHVELNAQKSFVTSAGEADGYVVSTRTPNTSGATDTMLYLVLKEDRGVRISGGWNGLGMRGNGSAPMVLENCSIPSSRALSKHNEGFSMMLSVVLPWFNLSNAAISVGISEAAVAAATTHIASKRFEESGSNLSDLPTLRARLAQMRIETDRARAHLSSVIDSVEQPGAQTTLMVLESKSAAADAVLRVTDIGMISCGGAAFSKQLSLERNFRDARAAAVMGPTSDVLQDFIGRAMCGMPLF
jgi:alkylation response protein AidB-like acyl-CoA dehydrogenase